MQAQQNFQSGTSIQFFNASSSKLYIYRMENPLDLNIVHIEIGGSAQQMDDFELLDAVKKLGVEQGYLLPNEEVAMIC